MLVRLQAEKELGNLEDNVSSQQSQISKLAQCLPSQTNTRIEQLRFVLLLFRDFHITL
jgi:hypothetical protein